MFCSWPSYYADLRWYGTSEEVGPGAITLRVRLGKSHYIVGTIDILLILFAVLASGLCCFGKRDDLRDITELSWQSYPSLGNKDRRICAVFYALP